MNTHSSNAMLARIAGYPHAVSALVKRLREVWDNPKPYRPGDHYMRGPGPKGHKKHGHDQSAKMVQQPLLLGEKWDS
jgi:hypothetical protein